MGVSVKIGACRHWGRTARDLMHRSSRRSEKEEHLLPLPGIELSMEPTPEVSVAAHVSV